jgi:predicted thioredoxin/glutaredoxin
MATIDEPSSQSDLEEVCRLLAEGKKVTDPQLLRRIRERSEQATREVFEKHGLLNIAVDLIREGRAEEGSTSWIPTWP